MAARDRSPRNLKQLQLFGNEPPQLRPAARGTKPTSRSAAEKIGPHVDEASKRVLGAINHAGGATCDEIEIRIGMIHQSVSARISGLAAAGLIRDSGEKRPTQRGRGAIVWTVTRSSS